jgi:glycosyltransferase involved in cell wall biosynthesis
MRRERALALRQFRHADAVIAVSNSTAADAERLAGVDPARITVIAEGVALRPGLSEARLAALRATLRLPERFVLAVGTFDPRKRIDVLADVVRRLRRHHHDVGLVIAGFQGSFTGAVERSLHDAGIRQGTRVLGHVGDEELAGLYQMSACLLFTSAYEGFGLPPLEAMACGTPAAVFDNSSLREVVGEAGLIIEDGSSAKMAAAVRRLLEDREERERVVRVGRERAALFTWERTAEATLKVYAAVLLNR